VRPLCNAYTHTAHAHSARSSALDEISGETVAIKQVTRVLDKVPLREITLLRHFANHENITGLIDLDAISPDFNEMCVRRPILVPAR
jgi:hypothetical protein